MALLTLMRARALLERVGMLENETNADRMIDDLRRDPKWLLLPPARRATALERHHALLAYEKIERPTAKDTDFAASSIGVGRRIFYRLLSDWRENGRSIFSLVPYLTLAKPRQSKLPEAVVTVLQESAKTIVAENHAISPSAAVRRIREGWPENIPQPSAVTIRNYLDRELAERPVEVGSMPIEIAFKRMSAKLTARRFGEVLVVDHTAPARMRVDGTPARAPTITLVMDLHTGVPVGAAVTMVRPTQQATLDALADAKSRLARRMNESNATPPTIVVAMPFAAKWSKGLAVLREHGCRVIERGVYAPRMGEMVRQLVGSKLGDLPLMAARADEDGVFEVDVEQEALLSLHEARFVIDAAVEQWLDQHFPTDVARGMTMPLLPAVLASRADLATLCSVDDVQGAWRPAFDEDLGGDDAHRLFDLTDSLRKLAIATGGDDLAGVHVQEPTPSEPYWIVNLRPSSPAVGQRIWRDISSVMGDTNFVENEQIVVLLQPSHL